MRQPHKTAKHTPKIRRHLPTNCLSVFDDFVGLALKGLSLLFYQDQTSWQKNRFHSVTEMLEKLH